MTHGHPLEDEGRPHGDNGSAGPLDRAPTAEQPRDAEAEQEQGAEHDNSLEQRTGHEIVDHRDDGILRNRTGRSCAQSPHPGQQVLLRDRDGVCLQKESDRYDSSAHNRERRGGDDRAWRSTGAKRVTAHSGDRAHVGERPGQGQEELRRMAWSGTAIATLSGDSAARHVLGFEVLAPQNQATAMAAL